MKFDELNVLENVKELYDGLEKDNEEIFMQLARSQYKEQNPNSDKKLSKKWLLGILEDTDPVTKYVYTNEVLRKQDYIFEAITGSKASKGAQFTRGMKLWAGMTAQYADTIADKATLQAYSDKGYSRVEWVTQEDDRVCDECWERDGKIYPINDIPPKPHWRCRCYYVPVD